MERQGRRGRDRPDPQLDRCPVRDELGDVLADPPFDLANRAARVLVGRHVHLDRQVDLVDVDEAVAEGPGHRPVELDDDRPGGPDRGMHRLDRDAQGAEAVGIRRRRVDQDGIERQRPAVEEVRDLGQEDGHVVGATFVDRSPLAFGPTNSARWRKWDAISGARCGPGPSVWRWIIPTFCNSGARATSASSRTEGVAAAHWR